MNKRIICFALVVLFLIFGMAGLAWASPYGYHGDEVGVDAGGGYFDTGGFELPNPDLSPPTPPVGGTSPIDSSWQMFTGLDRKFVPLTIGGSSTIVNLTVPSGMKGQVSWISLDPSVATVVANSPARITPAGVGKTWVVAVVKTDTRTYYDACLVEVVVAQAASVGVTAAPATQPTATPSTAGGLNNALIGIVLLSAALPFLRRNRF